VNRMDWRQRRYAFLKRKLACDAKTTRSLSQCANGCDAINSQLLGIQLLGSVVLACLAIWMGAELAGGRQLSIGPWTALALASLPGSVTALVHYLFAGHKSWRWSVSISGTRRVVALRHSIAHN
jgi:hypothetical protein